MKKKLVAAIATTAIALTVSGGAVASADDRMGRKVERKSLPFFQPW